MASKIKVDQIQTADGTGTIALQNQLSGMTTASLPALGSAQMPTGSVLQVVGTGTFSRTEMSSGSWNATNNSASITPSSSSNKVLVTCTNHVRVLGTTEQLRGGLRIKRGSTVVWNSDGTRETVQVRNASNEHDTMVSICFLDSPSTTSSTTYTLEANLLTGTTFYIFESIMGASMVLQEIKG